MLDEIIQNNEELAKHPAIIPILKKIESIIPIDARGDFCRNLKTLKIELSKIEGKVMPGECASYFLKENKLYLYMDFDKYLIGEWSNKNKEETTKEMFESSLCHELIHMSSTTYFETDDLVNSGFAAVIGSEKVLNPYLNEGFTEMLAETLYPGSYVYSGYKDIVHIAKIITNIVGIDVIKKLYFSNKLAINLQNYIAQFTMPENIKSLFFWIENLQRCKIKNNSDDYNHSLQKSIFLGLLPILSDALNYEIKNGTFKSIQDLENYYNTYIKPDFESLFNILLKNGYNPSLLGDYLEEYGFDINNYPHNFICSFITK